MNRSPRTIAVAVGAFVVLIVGLNLIATGLDDSVGGRKPTGAPNSTYSSTEDGLSAYFELLTRYDHPVDRIRGEIGDSNLDPADTFMLIAPETVLSDDDEFILDSFVESGGRLVVAGVNGGVLARVLGSDAPTATSGEEIYTEFAPELLLLDEVEVQGTVGYEAEGDFTALASTQETVLAGRVAIGAGEVVFVGDESLFQNGRIAEADNAALALELAGESGRTVVFAEGVHGYGSSSGLDAVPTRWKYALGFLVLAAFVYAFARGRRFGPPDRPHRELPPARGEYVAALGTTLTRTADRTAALSTVATNAREHIAARAGLPPDADRAAIDAAARGLGFSEEEIAALWHAPSDDEGVMRLGRAAAHANDGKAGT